MDHFCNIKVEFTSSIPSKRFDVLLMKDGIELLTMYSDIPAGTNNYTVENSLITDDDNYTIRVVNASNSADYKDSKQFTIQKRLRVGFRLGTAGSRL